MLYVFLFGSTDTGEPIEQAVALAAVLYIVSAVAIGGRRSCQLVTRS